MLEHQKKLIVKNDSFQNRLGETLNEGLVKISFNFGECLVEV